MFTKVNNEIILTDTAYNFGKKLVQVYIPAFSALYFGLSAVWGLPAAEQVVGTSACVVVFLSSVMGISSKNYEKSGAAYDGVVEVIKKPEGGMTYSLNLDGDPNDLQKMDTVSFKVENPFRSDS